MSRTHHLHIHSKAIAGNMASSVCRSAEAHQKGGKSQLENLKSAALFHHILKSQGSSAFRVVTCLRHRPTSGVSSAWQSQTCVTCRSRRLGSSAWQLHSRPNMCPPREKVRFLAPFCTHSGLLGGACSAGNEAQKRTKSTKKTQRKAQNEQNCAILRRRMQHLRLL